MFGKHKHKTINVKMSTYLENSRYTIVFSVCYEDKVSSIVKQRRKSVWCSGRVSWGLSRLVKPRPEGEELAAGSPPGHKQTIKVHHQVTNKQTKFTTRSQTNKKKFTTRLQTNNQSSPPGRKQTNNSRKVVWLLFIAFWSFRKFCCCVNLGDSSFGLSWQ